MEIQPKNTKNCCSHGGKKLLKLFISGMKFKFLAEHQLKYQKVFKIWSQKMGRNKRKKLFGQSKKNFILKSKKINGRQC